MKYEIKIHPLNVEGKYYVDEETCLVHGCCYDDAPNNFTIDEDTKCAYVFKQPATGEEERNCKNAMDACPVFAIHDDGI